VIRILSHSHLTTETDPAPKRCVYEIYSENTTYNIILKEISCKLETIIDITQVYVIIAKEFLSVNTLHKRQIM
jgi:hypothetical protein